MANTKSKSFFTTVLMAVTIVAGFFLLKPYTVTVPVERIQSILDENVPKHSNLAGKFALWEYDVNISDVILVIRDEDTAVVRGSIAGVVADRNVSTDFEVVGKPDYRNGDFYFLPSEQTNLTNFTVSEGTAQNKSLLERGKDLFKKDEQAEEDLTANDVRKKAIGNLLDKAVDKAAEHAGLSRDEVETLVQDEIKKRAPGALQKIFANTPLYSLDQLGAKGSLLGAMLYSVKMSEGEIAIKFSLGTLVVKVIAICLLIAVVVLLAIGMARAGIVLPMVPFFD